MRNPVIDSDTHIIESEAIWDLLDPALRNRRPLRVDLPEDTAFGRRNVVWMIDGIVVPKPIGKGGSQLPTPAGGVFDDARTDTRRECRELVDIPARLADMDRMGVDVQVIYPTLFIRPVAEDPALQIGLCHAYNEFLGRAHDASDGRLRWVVVPPLGSMPAVIEEMRAGKARGAVGVLLLGIDLLGSLAEPSFYPLYEEAVALDMPVCIHSGIGSFSLANEFKMETNSFTTSMPVLMAFRDLVVSRIPEKFPGIRFAFVENGSAWLPYAFYQLGRRRKAADVSRVEGGKGTYFSGDVPEGAELMRNYEMYVTCMLDEDLPYILSQAAEDRLIVGSDYAHVDPAFQSGMVEGVRKLSNVGESFADSVLTTNPMRLYGIGPIP